MNDIRLDIDGELKILDKLRGTSAELKKVSDGAKEVSDTFKREGSGVERAIDKQTQALKREDAAVDELKKDFTELSATQRAATDSRKVTTFNRSLGGLRSGVRSLGAAIKSAFLPLLAVTGVVELIRGVGRATEAYKEQELAVTKVRQAIESTEGAADRALGQLVDDAEALQRTTLFGDDQILNEVTAQLLTFTNIAGDAFDRTQKVALDLATVLDGDLQSASIQLGKALNDPVSNLSALSRSGIQFSDSQEQLIKSLATTNRLAEAQAVILDELERQYGGQAEAAALAEGGFTQLSNSLGDLFERFGGQAFNVLSPIVFFLQDIVDGINDFLDTENNFTAAFDAIADVVSRAFNSFTDLLSALNPLRDSGIQTADVIEGVGRAFRVALIPLEIFINGLTTFFNTYRVIVNEIKELSNDLLGTEFNVDPDLGLGTLQEDVNRFGQIIRDGFSNTPTKEIADEIESDFNRINRTIEQSNELTDKQLKERLRLQSQFQNELSKLLSDADQAELESLSIEDRIVRENELRNQGIDALEATLIAKARAAGLGEEEVRRVEEASDILRLESQRQFNEDLRNLQTQFNEEQANITAQGIEDKRAAELLALEQSRDIFSTQEAFEEFKADRLLEIQRDYLLAQLQLLEQSGMATSAEIDNLKLQILELDEELAQEAEGLTGFDAFLGKLFDIDDQGQIDNLKAQISVFANELTSAISEAFDTEIEAKNDLIAELDDALSQTEDRLDEQLELEKQGFANSADLERAKIEDIEAQRQKALEDREKLEARQRFLDNLSNQAGLVVAGVNILKQTTQLGPLGLVIGGAAIAGLFSLFKGLVASAATATLAQGDTITTRGRSQKTVKGRLHSQGGEHLLDHVEVEHGESLSVHNRRGTRKHIDVIKEFDKAVNTDRLGLFFDKFAPAAVQSFDLKAPDVKAFSTSLSTKELERRIDNQTIEFTKELSALRKIMKGQPVTYKEGKVTVTKVGNKEYRSS